MDVSYLAQRLELHVPLKCGYTGAGHENKQTNETHWLVDVEHLKHLKMTSSSFCETFSLITDDSSDGLILINTLNLCDDLMDAGKGHKLNGISYTDSILQNN